MEAEQEHVEIQGNFAEINATEEPEQGEQPQIDLQVEERARLQGWVSQEEFRGDKERHITAQEFVERADHMMPILKCVNRKLETKLTERDKQLDETQKTLERVVSMQEKAIQDAYKQKKTEIEDKKIEAVENADTELYTKLDKQEKDLEAPPAKEEPPAQKTIPEGASKWVEENKAWFGVDKELTSLARFVGKELEDEGHPLNVPGKEYEFGLEVSKRLETMRPDKFSNQNQNNSEFDAGNVGGSGEQQTGKKGWGDLPQAAQQQCKVYEQNIPGFTRETYVKDYFESEE